MDQHVRMAIYRNVANLSRPFTCPRRPSLSQTFIILRPSFSYAYICTQNGVPNSRARGWVGGHCGSTGRNESPYSRGRGDCSRDHRSNVESTGAPLPIWELSSCEGIQTLDTFKHVSPHPYHPALVWCASVHETQCGGAPIHPGVSVSCLGSVRTWCM